MMFCSLKHLLIAGTLAGSFLLPGSPWYMATGQDVGRVPTISRETYERVIDLIFRRNNGDFRDQQKEFTISVRVIPSFEAGSHANITKYRNGSVKIVSYTLAKRTPSIGEQLNLIFRETKREDPEELARRLNVQTHEVSDSPAMRRLLNKFATLRFTPQLDTSIVLDATGLQLWYDTISNKAWFSLADTEPKRDSLQHPLIRWIKEVQSAVLR